VSTCKDCRWWGVAWDGVCDAPQSDTERKRGTIYEGAKYAVKDSAGFAIHADAADDSDLYAHLVTGPDFGCVKFKAKE